MAHSLSRNIQAVVGRAAPSFPPPGRKLIPTIVKDNDVAGILQQIETNPHMEQAMQAGMRSMVKRGCGECQACCEGMPVAEPGGFSKPRDQKCVHQCGGGCAIYETRPRSCQFYQCAWTTIPKVDESLRPDRSGFIVDTLLPNQENAAMWIAWGRRYTVLRATALENACRQFLARVRSVQIYVGAHTLIAVNEAWGLSFYYLRTKQSANPEGQPSEIEGPFRSTADLVKFVRQP